MSTETVKCATCIRYKSISYSDMEELSVLCNMVPAGSNLELLNHCLCGHPYLATAHEDYERWNYGKEDGETDAERAERTGYPTLQEWYSGRSG